MKKIAKSTLLLALSLTFLIFPLFNLKNWLLAQEPEVTNQILVKYRSGTREEIKKRIRQRVNSVLVGRVERLETEVVRVPFGQVREAIHQLLQDINVEYAEPDYKAWALELTSDPGIVEKLQWGMYQTQAASEETSAWYYTKSNSDIKIAILDTGIDQNHPDLATKIVENHNCTTTSSINDLHGHGTHVAGIAAALTNNALGVAGLGYNAALVNAKVLDETGSGYYSWIASCLTWTADYGVKVINLSLGAPYKSKTLENAVNYAWGKGAVLVAAAGNNSNSSPTYPAYYKNVIAVAATDQNDQKASFSSFGRWVDVAAPGVKIYSTFPGQNYYYGSGTSMATPHVAGLAALVWATNFGTSNLKVRNQIELTADKIPGTRKYWSYGRINARKAVSEEINTSQKNISSYLPF